MFDMARINEARLLTMFEHVCPHERTRYRNNARERLESFADPGYAYYACWLRPRSKAKQREANPAKCKY